jgi:hypothetical protein
MEPQSFEMKFSTTAGTFDNQTDEEIARILRETADKILRGVSEGVCRDGNGNTIGTFKHRHQ